MIIDKLIEKYAQNPNNVALDYDMAVRKSSYSFDKEEVLKLKVVTVEDLEQIRPYIELAELISNDHEFKIENRTIDCLTMGGIDKVEILISKINKLEQILYEIDVIDLEISHLTILDKDECWRLNHLIYKKEKLEKQLQSRKKIQQILSIIDGKIADLQKKHTKYVAKSGLFHTEYDDFIKCKHELNLLQQLMRLEK